MVHLPTHSSIVLITLTFLLSGAILAQQNVGIGTTTPDTSAILDILSTDKGILIPRLSTAQRIAIPSPANGLLVFDTDANSLYNYHENAWHRIALPEDGIPGDFLQINRQNDVQWLPFLDKDALPPPDPEEIGNLTIGGTLGFMQIRGNYIYLLDSGKDSLLVIDISDKTAPFRRGQVAVGPYPQSLEVVGQYAYIGDRDLNQLLVFHIADPDSMYSVDTLVLGDLPAEMVYAMGHLYVIDQVDNNLRSFDLSDPAHPVEVSNIPLPATDGITRLKAQGNFLYYIMNGVLGAIDISQAEDPQIRGTLGIHNATISLSVAGPYAYTVNHQQDLLKIYNVSDPDNFFFVGNAPTDQFVLDIDAKNRFAFIVGQTSDLLRIVDVNEPATPQEVATIPAGSVPKLVQVDGNYAYVIDGGAGVLRIVGLGRMHIVSANMMGEIEQVTDLSGYSTQWAKNGDMIYNTNYSFVGIGTSTPEQKLDIRGGGPDDAALLMLGNGDTSHYLLLFPGRQNDPEPFIRWKAGDPLRFGTDENIFSSKMHIESNGNIGIGTSLPGGTLEVEKLNDSAADNYHLVLHNPSNTTGSSSFISFSGSAAPAGTDGFNPGSIGFIRGTGLVFRANSGAAPLTRMTILSANGNTGIGTTTPQSKLDVEGNLAIGLNYSGTTPAPVNGAIIEGRVGIGTNSTTLAHLTVNGESTSASQGIRSVVNFTGDQDIRSIYASAITNPGWGYGAELIGGYTGVRGLANASGFTGDAFGVRGVATGTAGLRYGVWGSATNPGPEINIGIYGEAANATNNWAGYFEGNGYFSNNLGIGTTAPTTAVKISKDMPVVTLESSNALEQTGGQEMISRLTFRGHKSNLYRNAAFIDVAQDGTWSAVDTNFAPSAIRFYTQSGGAVNDLLLPRMTLDATGSLVIGSEKADGHLLSVDGKIACEEVLVNLSQNWPDYVFSEDYTLPPLDYIAAYIAEHRHLPGVPPAEEIETGGLHVGEMQRILMEKIEELTLYMIDLKKENKALHDRIEFLEKRQTP